MAKIIEDINCLDYLKERGVLIGEEKKLFECVEKLNYIEGFKPIYKPNFKIIFIGTIPSKTSKEKEYFYANKNNTFWEQLKLSVSENNTEIYNVRKDIKTCTKYGLAFTDVFKDCLAKKGSQDQGIVAYNYNKYIIEILKARLKINNKFAIFCTSAKAKSHIKKLLELSKKKRNLDIYHSKVLGEDINMVCLSSPSASNKNKNNEGWNKIKNYL